jgi:hypothetical protein
MNILLVYPKFPDTFWSFFHPLLFPGRANAFGGAIPNRNETTRIHPNGQFMNREASHG